jgi:DNA-binding GntR family transcriptional regulator
VVDTASSSRAARPKQPKRAPANLGDAVTQAVADLTRYLTSGEFNLGDTVPSEAELRERFGHSEYATRGALKKLRTNGLIVTAQGRRATLAEAKPRHTLTRDAGDPTRHLRPTGPADNHWRTADPVTAELFDLHDRAPVHISELICEHRTTGALVHTTRTVPVDVIADIESEPDPYGSRAGLLKAFTECFGPLSATERTRPIKPVEAMRTALGLDPAALAVELRRLTRGESGRLLMIESEIVDATSAEWEYLL